MAEREWTPEQLNAITANTGTVLVSAAAGSGKTSVLVERIVRKLTAEKDPCLPEELLVVTFTNASAAEMRSRIFARLNEIMNSDAAERKRLKGLKTRLDEMQISTMDAFCIKLVRENFHACNVEPDFTIIDKGLETVLKNETVKYVIETLYSKDRDNFIPLAKQFEAGRNDRNLISAIIALSDFSMSEPDPEMWLSGVGDNFTLKPAKHSVWGKVLCSCFSQALDYAKLLCEKEERELSYYDELAHKYCDMISSDAKCIESLTEFLEQGEWDDFFEAVLNVKTQIFSRRFSADKNFTGDFHRATATAVRSELKEVIKSVIELIPASESDNEKDVLMLQPIAFELIKAVDMFNMELLNRKREKNSYSFSDITHFALSILSDANASDGKTPLARTLSTGFKEILIDEYQDTNRSQDTLFTCLSTDGNNMFMVGDVKQSIYRFRLASPEIFIEKFENYPMYDGKQKRSKIILSANFRSRKGITDAVNYMFSAVMSKSCGEIEYNENERLNFGAKTFYPQHEQADAELHVIANDNKNEYETEARYIAEMIRKSVDGGDKVTVKDGYRDAVYSDYCILLRSAKNIASIYAAELRKKGIPAILDSHEGFFDTAEIKLAMAFLKTVDNPANDVELLAVMLSPVFGFLPDDAATVKITARKRFGGKKYSLYNALKLCAGEKGGKFKYLVDTLNLWRKMSASENVVALIKRIYCETALPNIFGGMSEGAFRKANLRTLLLAAERFIQTSNSGLSGFVRYLETVKENNGDLGISSSVSKESGVTIMTMHRSKGLEFPFVYIAGLTKRRMNDASTLFVNHRLGLGFKIRIPEKAMLYDTLSGKGVAKSKEEESISEELRIFYVAMTRAKEKLHIVMAPKNCEKSISELEQISFADRSLPVYAVKHCSAPWKWFIMAFCRHPDADAIRFVDSTTVSGEGRFKVIFAKPVECEPEPDSAEEQPSPEIVGRISQSMSFSYAYAPIAGASSKHTASNLSSEKFTPAFFGKSMPAFMFSSSLTPVQKGTATHLFLQFCDFSKCENGIRGEIERLVSKGRLSPQLADGVDEDSVSDFFKSELYGRIKCADEVIRERQFTLIKDIGELESDCPKEFAGEKTVVIGKIDLIFIKGKEAFIVDYKTDSVNDVNALAEHYRKQMEIYADAVERSMGLTVRECILYSIKLRESVTCLKK